MVSTRFVWLVAASIVFQSVIAQTSLYIPGFDPQPVTADVLGVGSDGRTTWAIAPGQPSGSLTDEAGFVGTATLIEGPSDAVVVLSNDVEYASESCAISGSLANCVIFATANGISSTETFQETASPFPVQAGSSQPTAASGPSAPASSPTASPSSPSGSSPEGSSTSPSSPASPSNTQGSSAVMLSASSIAAVFIALTAALSML